MNYNSFYFVNQPSLISQQSKSANDSALPTSQFFQQNPVLSNPNLASPLMPPQFVYYSLMPPVSPTSTVFMQPNMPVFSSYPYQHQAFDNKINTCMLPAIEFGRLILKGVPIHATTFDIIEFLKDCGEVNQLEIENIF